MFAATEGYYADEDINHAVVRILRNARTPEHGPGTVLDIGCGRARLGAEIEKLGYRVTGIDNNPIAQTTARRRLAEVLDCNIIDFGRLGALLDGRRFDWLVTADVLEHLPDPLGALRCYRRFLQPHGRLVISLPNVAVWDNRLRLMCGHFDYADSGVLDRTHLRFFTFRTARRLLAEAGFAVPRTTWEPGIVRAFLPLLKPLLRGNGAEAGAILESGPYQFYAHYVMPVEHAVCAVAPGLLAFRIVMSAPLAAIEQAGSGC
jgi:2-polyprenyl-3-methyl-5-hydroxy-6-metoxy-1,4-benzoquinol methylase